MPAGISAVSSKQPNGAIAAGARKDRTVCSQARPDPYDTEALNVAVMAHDFEAGGGEPQIGEVGVFQADVRLIDLAVIAWNGVAQFIDVDCGHQLNCGPR